MDPAGFQFRLEAIQCAKMPRILACAWTTIRSLRSLSELPPFTFLYRNGMLTIREGCTAIWWKQTKLSSSHPSCWAADGAGINWFPHPIHWARHMSNTCSTLVQIRHTRTGIQIS
jgi:hypothetical protein